MPKFPFTNYHELNLDWILKKVTALFDASEENARTIRTYETRLTSAEQTATSAGTAATAAQQLADAASANANSALSVAGTADSKADSALTAATNAAAAVENTLTIAQAAQQTAAAAVATANDAAATASSLESLANTANQNATAALETAQTADQKAVAAQTAATTADQKAVAAQTAATTNAGNISTLQTDVSNLNRQISESITPAIEEIETALDGKAPVIINNASGDIASFADGADGMPVKSLVANIEPVQDLHGYDYPWPEGGGKNKLPVTMTSGTTSSGIVQNVDSFGVITLTGATSGSIYLGVVSIVTLPAGTYTVNGMASNSYSATLQVRNGSASGTTFATDSGSGAQFTLESETAVAAIIRIPTNTTISNSIVVKPMIRLATETDATFAPYSNICPISGHTECTVGVVGVNWLPDNLTFTDGLRDDNGGQTASTVSHYSEPFPIKPNTTYKGSGVIRSNANPRIYFLDSNKNWISRTAQFLTDEFTFTTPENCYYIQVQCSKDVDCTAGMISLDQSAAVTPYVGNTSVTISWQTEAGTVYSGTVDAVSGKMVVDRVAKRLTVAENLSGAYPGSLIWNSRGAVIRDADEMKPFICNRLKYVGSQSTSSEWKFGACINANGTSFNLWLKDSAFASLADATAWLEQNETQICYYLKSPVTYQLSPQQIKTLYAQNNIWTDVGAVDVEYPADTKLYIEQLTKPTEDDMTADHAIASGTFFMIGNTLYLATSQIAAGGTITPGTNATKLSLADALNQLNT